MSSASEEPSSPCEIRIVLCHTSHPGNIGGAARAMKTMGLRDLRIVAPKRFPDPEAVALASGIMLNAMMRNACEVACEPDRIT